MYLYYNKLDEPFDDYLLRTFHDIDTKRIYCSLYKGGEVRSNRYFPLDQISDDELANFAYECHQSELEELHFLVGLWLDRASLSFEKHYLLVKIIMKRGFYDEVITSLEQLISFEEAKNNLDQIIFFLGNVNEKLGNYEEALLYYKNAVKLKPKYPDYSNSYASSLLKLEKTTEAIQTLEAAIKLNVYYAEAHFNLGLAHVQNRYLKKDYSLSKEFPEIAMKSFYKAIELDPGYENKSFKDAERFLEQQEWGKAYQTLLKAKQKTNNNSLYDPIMDFSLLLLKDEEITIDKISSYIQKLEHLEKKYPNYPDLLNEKGIAYFLMSKSLNNLALKYFKEALKLNQNYKKAQSNLNLIEKESIGHEIILNAIKR